MAAVWMFIVAKQTEIIFENHQYHPPYFKSIFHAKSLKLKLKVIWSQLKKVSPAMVIFFLAFVDMAALMSFLGADLLVNLHEEKK